MTSYVAVLALATLALADAAGFLGTGDSSTGSIFAIKDQVQHSEVFQRKVAALCARASRQDACNAKVSDALFCQLLQRSKPEVAAEQCGAAKPAHKAASLLQT